MPKPLVNNKIIYQNIHGRVVQHDLYLDQGVKKSDSPTFASLQLTGDATIEGNLYVQGNSTILDSNIIEFEDNIVKLNRLETGSGVTLNQAGFEIERGSLENYKIVFNENDDTFRIGLISNTQAVATREDNPLDGGVMIYNDTTKRLDSRDTIAIDLSIVSTTNSSSSSSGCLTLSGGLGIQKDTHLDGTLYLTGSSHSSMLWTDSSDSLNITSSQDINIMPSSRVNIPFDKKVTFGSTGQSISANNLTNDIDIYGKGNVYFYLEFGKRISVPNQVPITFSTLNEKVYTDGSNNMVVAGSQDVELRPGPFHKVFIPVDTPFALGTASQSLTANTNNDLAIVAGNDILLTPGNAMDVKIPTDSGIKLGNGGYQRIFANSNNELIVLSTGDIYLSPTQGSHIYVPADVRVAFSGYSQYITGDTLGNLYVSASGKTTFQNTQVVLSSTSDSDSGSSGSLFTQGGLGVQKTLYCEKSVIIDSNEDDSLIVRKQGSTQDTFVVNNSNNGKVNIIAGNGLYSQPSLELSSTSLFNAGSLLQLLSQFDQTLGYTIGRGTTNLNTGRALTVNLPTHADYNNTGAKPKFVVTTDDHTKELFAIETDTGNITTTGILGLTNTENAVNATTASFVVYGGLGVVKDIITNGKFTSITNSTQAILIKDALNNAVFTVNTSDKEATFDSKVSINHTIGQLFALNDSFVANASTNTIINDFQTLMTNTSDSSDVSNGALVISGGASIHKKFRVSDTAYFGNDINMTNTKITNLANPVGPQDAANKAYVDLVKQGLFVKDSVKVATVLSGDLLTEFATGSVIDGYTLQSGDRILIKDQTDKSENGLYTVQSGSPQRTVDLQENTNASGIFVYAQVGTTNGSLGWICNSDPDSDIVGTDDLNFTQFTGLGQIDAGTGLSKNFNQINVNVDDASLEIFTDSLRIKNTALGTGMTGGSGSPLQTTTDQSHVTKLGAINSGSWEGSTVHVSYGGTGRTQFTTGNILYGNGIDGINTHSLLYFDESTRQLGVGTNNPSAALHVQSDSAAQVLINADASGNSTSAAPQLTFAHGSTQQASLRVARDFNDSAANVHADALVISNDKVDTSSNIQFTTQQEARLTILHDGKVGINTSAPNAMLDVAGTFVTRDLNVLLSTVNSTGYTDGSLVVAGGVGITQDLHVGGQTVIHDTFPSTDVNSGALVVEGGLSVKCNQNSSNIGNGGALTVAGGASIGTDLYVGGEINGSGSSSSTFAYLTLTATDEAINLTSGALVTFGGVTIQATTNATSVTNGGSLLVAGGASVGDDLYVGGSQFIYGNTNFYSPFDNILNLMDDSDNNRFSINKNATTHDFSISRYDSNGDETEKSLYISNSTGSVFLNNTTASLSSTQSSLVVQGGVSVNAVAAATSLTSGGCATLQGGISIGKNMLVGGDVTIFSSTESTNFSSGSLIIQGGSTIAGNTNIGGELHVKSSSTLEGALNLIGNSLLDTISNTSGSSLWNYLGRINKVGQTTGHTEITFSNGVSKLTSLPAYIHTLKLIVSINGSNVNFAHSQSGDVIHSSSNKIDCYIYENNDDYHLFVLTPAQSTTNVNVFGQLGNKFVISGEGLSMEPDGTTSGYNNTWTNVYTTKQISNLGLEIGNLTVEGESLKVCDNIPIIGYNNSNTTASRNLGILFQRFQMSNDDGTGDIVSDSPSIVDSIPDQSTANADQLKLSNITSSIDNHYAGWWIKIVTGTNINQVRQIIGYNGSQRVAQLDSPFTNIQPSTGDTVYLYGSQYVATYFDESENVIKLGFGSVHPTGTIENHGDCDLQIKHLFVSDTTASANASTGSICTLGGISINNTNNSTSCTSGGSLTTLGGAGIKGKLHVGEEIAVGNNAFIPQESIHINNTNSTVRLENEPGNHSYIDFVEAGSSSRHGILRDSDLLSVTWTSSGESPNTASKALTVNSAGYVGINTTNSNTPLSLATNNFISSSSNDGYIGIIAADSNTSDSDYGARLMLYGNDSVSQSGDLSLFAGTSGSIKMHTRQDTEALRIDSLGVTRILSTSNTKSKTSGALLVSGGVAIAATENSQSFFNGGALTVAGGVSVEKDIYIGGNLYITGNLNATGSVLTPTVTFTNTQGCSIVSFGNTNLLTVSNEATLSFYVEVTPLAESQNCQFEFTLPYRTNSFIERGELVATCSGYTDDTEIIPLFNTICVGVKTSTTGLVKFQSSSTGIHFFTILCRYAMI
jgi:hypothetical protein